MMGSIHTEGPAPIGGEGKLIGDGEVKLPEVRPALWWKDEDNHRFTVLAYTGLAEARVCASKAQNYQKYVFKGF
jgi:hypothetical protein